MNLQTNLVLRWSLLLLLGLLTFSLGLIRYNYILNFIRWDLPFLLPRISGEQAVYPMDFSSFFISLFKDPRWFSSIIYLIYPAIATCISIYLIFQKRKYVLLALLFYSFGLVLLMILIVYSLLFQDYENGYAIAQYFKKIFQEPYASLLLLGSFYWDENKKNS